MTPRQKDMLDAIRDLTVDGVSPTYEELRVHLGLASKAGVNRMIEALKRLGYLRSIKGCRRTVEVINRTPCDLGLEVMSIDELHTLSYQIRLVIAARTGVPA